MSALIIEGIRPTERIETAIRNVLAASLRAPRRMTRRGEYGKRLFWRVRVECTAYPDLVISQVGGESIQSATSRTRNGTRVQLVGTSISFSSTQRPSNTKSDVSVMPLRTATSRSSLLTFGISTVMLTASLRISNSRPLRHRESVEGPISV